MKRALRVNFVDFWRDFSKTDNYFHNLLETKYDLVIDEHDPQLLFYSGPRFGNQHLKYARSKTKKIFYTGENVRPPFSECDYAFSFDCLDDPRNYRLPLWVLYLDWFGKDNKGREPSYLVDPNSLIKDNNSRVDRIRSEKYRFCGFLYRNPSGNRVSFLSKLSEYKRVHSTGQLLNNCGFTLGGNEQHKLDFLNSCKFTIAFENASYPGYVTEKIVHPMAANSIPIYWGSERIGEEFNSRSFVNLYDFSNEEEVIEQIRKIDNDDSLYERYLREPWFHNNDFPEYVKPQKVLQKLMEIVES